MWGVVRARCVPSVPWSTSWLCVALLRVLSLLLVTVALLLGYSCHSQFSLSCTQLAILAPIQAIASEGGATTAAARGVPDHLIKTLGRWSSDAYQIYIRTPVSSIVHV